MAWQRKRSDFFATKSGDEGMGNWMKMVKRYKLPVTGNISTRDVIYNLINIIHTAACYIWKLLRD